MKIKDITQHLESIAPPMYQESYDNSGLIVGDGNAKVRGVLICLDSIESIIDEAIRNNCNLVIAHHPIVFKGLKRFNGKNYVERTVMKAIKHDIAIYAIHTNLDNVKTGVNAKIAEKLGLINTRILSPKRVMKKLFAFLPVTHGDLVKNTLFKLGAGLREDMIHTSFAGIGAMSLEKETSPQIKLEVLFPIDLQSKIISTLNKLLDGENYNYDIVHMEAKHSGIGSGMIGELKKETDTIKFLKSLKATMKTGCVKHTAVKKKNIKKIAICGGSGGFLLNSAIAEKADLFITADYKYHEFFDADGRIIIADIGHYETEQYTIELIYELLKDNFSTFAVLKTKINTNPVNYL